MTISSFDSRVAPDAIEDSLYQAAARATLAPSIHNTQPWRFVVHADRLDLYADRTRRTPVIDPGGRQLAISCGAALFGARVALAAAQLDAVTELLPNPDEPDLLASITIAGSTTEVDESARRLDAVADARHTNRRQFGPDQIPDVVLDAVTNAAQMEGALLHPIRELDDRVATAVLTQRAEVMQEADPAYGAELGEWTSADPTRRDGIPTTAIPQGTGAAHDDIPMRAFDTSDRGVLPPETHSSLNETLLVLCTPGDGLRDWLIAGQALGRVLLELTSADLKATILSQVAEVASTRAQLGANLRLGGYNIQLLLRAGTAEQTPATPRRSLIDVISS